MKEITFQAMGTLILFKVSDETPDAVLETARRMVLDFEHRFSANADDSILADLKRHAGIRRIQVDTDIFQLIKVGKHYSLQPGFLNIAIGPLVHLWRIGFDDARKPNDAEIQEALRLIKPENIILDEENRTVFLTEPGMYIDLGSLAKGFFADIIKQYFQQQSVQSALINLGGNIVVMGFAQMLPTCDPETDDLFIGLQVPPANFIMVNQEGKRFVNEYGSRDQLSQAAIDNGGLFYLIADDKIKATAMNTNQEKIDREVAESQLFKADTLEELAIQIGVDPQTLVETVTNYNQYVADGYDPEFGKNVFELTCEVAPFYATPRRPALHHTMGGLKIDKQTHVINTNGQIIPGLYAADEVAGGIHAGNRLGGNSLTDIFTYGRIAGLNALSEKVDGVLV